MDFDLDDPVLLDPPRWNPWTRVQPVQFTHEQKALPREVRLCCAAARVGDPVRVSDGEQAVEGQIVRVAHSVLHIELAGERS